MKLIDWIFSMHAGPLWFHSGNGRNHYDICHGLAGDGGGFGGGFNSWGDNRKRGDGVSYGKKPESFVLDDINMEIEYLKAITEGR